MRLPIITSIATASALALSLSACSSTGSSQFTDFAKEVASDPRCGHVDRVQGNLGGLGGNNLAVYLERTCPAATPPAPPPPAAPPS